MLALPLRFAAVVAGVLVFSALPSAAQDECTGAVPIFAGLTAGSTATYVTGTTTACGTSHKDVWFLYIPACSGTAAATLCNPGSATFDAILAAFEGVLGCGALVPLACNDDTCGSSPAISFPVVAGTPYYISLGGSAGGSGSFTLSISCAQLGSHDECIGAIPIGNGLTTGTNLGATASPSAGMCGNLGADVWYVYTAPCSGVADATFCSPGNATFDTVLAAFDGAAPCAMPSQIACDDDTCVLRSKASFRVTVGSTYYLAIGGYAGQQGTFAISLVCHPAPANDDCAGAIPVALGINGPFSNQFASDGPLPSGGCASNLGDIWFSFTPACNGRYQIDTCGAAYDTVVSIEGGCGAAELACNADDPTGACGLSSRVEIDAIALVDYRIRVGRGGAASGSFQVNVSSVPTITYGSPLGPGSIAFLITGGPASGVYLDAVTFTQGSFPNGPFFGLDMTLAAALDLLAFGYPFFGLLDPCGASFLPPIVDPALSGLTIYSVAVVSDVTLTLPAIGSAPVSYTIP